MEAINFIKNYHKPYIGEINDKIVDEDGFNYYYYCNVINEALKLIKTNKFYLSFYSTYIEVYNYDNDIINYIFNSNQIKNKKINIYDLIDISILKIDNYIPNLKYIFNSPNDFLEEIVINSTIIFNETFSKLKELTCTTVYFNAIQPIEYLTLNINNTYNNNLLNNFDDILIKLPNIKEIILNKHHYENIDKKNNRCDLICYDRTLTSNYDHIFTFTKNLNVYIKPPKIIFKNTKPPKFIFKNLDNLILNFYNEEEFYINKINNEKAKHKIYNVNNITINTYFDLYVNNFKFIKINKSKGNFILKLQEGQINTFFLDCFNYSNSSIIIKNNLENIIKDKILSIINNINKLITIYPLLKNNNHSKYYVNEIKPFFTRYQNFNYDFDNGYYYEGYCIYNKKYNYERKKLINDIVNIICYDNKEKDYNKNLLNTLDTLNKIKNNFIFYEEDNYFCIKSIK